MKFDESINFNHRKLVTRILIAVILSGAMYVTTNSIAIAAISSLIFIIVIPIAKGRRANKSYQNYLSSFGEDFSSEYNKEIYNASIYGFVPSENRVVHCSVFANESGIIISKMSVKRFIPWASAIKHKIYKNRTGKYIELNINNLTTKSRLLIPWSEEFSHLLPDS